MVAEAIYVINKHAKKIRDERENDKEYIFDQPYEDQWGGEHADPQEHIQELNDGCNWCYTCDNLECDHDDDDDEEEEEHDICCSNNLCDECQEAIEKAEEELEKKREKREELKYKMEEKNRLYAIKEMALKKIKKYYSIIGYHDVNGTPMLYVEWMGYGYHIHHNNPQKYPYLGEITGTISAYCNSEMTLKDAEDIVCYSLNITEEKIEAKLNAPCSY